MLTTMTPARMDRLGGLGWVRKTNGSITGADRWRLRLKLVEGSLDTLRRVLPRATPTIGFAAFTPPKSRLALEAEQALQALGPGHDAIIGHSYRAWMFGLALAHLDRRESRLDPDEFYCAALLHDFGLISSTDGQDFTRAGSDRAIACAMKAGISQDRGDVIGDAICAHATPGVSIGRDGALGYYLQWGSIVDLSGVGRWQIAPPDIDLILGLHPPTKDCNEKLSGMVQKEAHAVPDGRFAWLVRHHLLR